MEPPKTSSATHLQIAPKAPSRATSGRNSRWSIMKDLSRSRRGVLMAHPSRMSHGTSSCLARRGTALGAFCRIVWLSFLLEVFSKICLKISTFGLSYRCWRTSPHQLLCENSAFCLVEHALAFILGYLGFRLWCSRLFLGFFLLFLFHFQVNLRVLHWSILSFL